MFLRSTAALALVLASATATLAQDCTSYGISKAYALVETYFQSHPTEILNAQLQFNAVAGYQELAPDGVWGPATGRKVCGMLESYEAINGAAPDEMIRNLAEAGDFVQWMAAMARANLNPNFEAPD